MDIRDRYEYTVIAAGTQNPRGLKFKVHEKTITALELLQQAKRDKIEKENYPIG